MAYKRFGYYNRGNKLALIQESLTGGGGVLAVAHCTLGGTYTTKDTCEAAGGQWIPSSGSRFTSNIKNKYTSPVENISKGLEIEYTYAPTYSVNTTGNFATEDTYKFFGWGSDGTNLVFFGPDAYNSDINTEDSYIYVEGSGRWNGLHKVKSGASFGVVTTKTKYSGLSGFSQISLTGDFSTDEHFTVGSDDDIREMANWESKMTAGKKYIYLTQAATADDTDSLYEITFSDTAGRINFVNKITINTSNEYVETATTITDASSDGVNLYPAVYEQITIYEGVDVMDDEDFELDLNHVQAKAVVHHVKAQIAEDKGDMDLRGYHMRLFKQEIDQFSNKRIRGIHVAQGTWNMR